MAENRGRYFLLVLFSLYYYLLLDYTVLVKETIHSRYRPDVLWACSFSGLTSVQFVVITLEFVVWLQPDYWILNVQDYVRNLGQMNT